MPINDLDDTRILITGGPGCGKSTLANRMLEATQHVWHTDRLIGHWNWEQQREIAQDMLYAPGPWVIEGVTVFRALKWWLIDNPTGKPCDILYWCVYPVRELGARGRGILTNALNIWPKLKPQLEARGVEIYEVRP